MIDTLRLTGPRSFYKFDPEVRTYTVWNKSNGQEKISGFQVQQNSKFRAYFHPAYDTISIEFNVGKLLFNENIYNYACDKTVIRSLIDRFAAVFFSGDYYISRIDLGGLYVFPSRDECVAQLECYRRARIKGSRIGKYVNQTYETSVFYSSRHHAEKVYIKGDEMKIPEFYVLGDGEDKVKMSGIDYSNRQYGFDLRSTLRYEKTYRFRELERIGMVCTPFKGIHINNFRTDLLLQDFFNVFYNWELEAVGPAVVVGAKSSIAALALLDSAGMLAEAQRKGIYSRMTLWRYKQKKRMIEYEPRQVSFNENLSAQNLQKLHYVLNFGAYKLFF